jgi:hypothetical protein
MLREEKEMKEKELAEQQMDKVASMTSKKSHEVLNLQLPDFTFSPKTNSSLRKHLLTPLCGA